MTDERREKLVLLQRDPSLADMILGGAMNGWRSEEVRGVDLGSDGPVSEFWFRVNNKGLTKWAKQFGSNMRSAYHGNEWDDVVGGIINICSLEDELGQKELDYGLAIIKPLNVDLDKLLEAKRYIGNEECRDRLKRRLGEVKE